MKEFIKLLDSYGYFEVVVFFLLLAFILVCLARLIALAVFHV